MSVFAGIARTGCVVFASLALGLTAQVGGASAQVGGSWTDVIPLKNNPVAIALLHNGQILTWSADNQLSFSIYVGSAPSQTYTSLFNPVTQRSVLRLVTSTLSDMFCPGIAILPDGRVLVNGGSSSANSNIYDPAYNTWTEDAMMNVARGYNSDVMLTDGSVLTLGGSWSGWQDEKKTGEVWSATTGWTMRSGITAQPITGPDPEDAADGYIYRGDNHPWLFAVSGGLVFHAGPSAAMHWITTSGKGTIVSAGNRADDAYSMNGQAVMYDVGKILKTGGAPGYENATATASTYVIDINDAIANRSKPVVREVAPMAYPRAFANGVLLPNGQVLIVGGQTYAVPFSDDNAVLVPELWDPTSETFTQLAPMQTPRNYHSTALLLPDARVFVGGGGLCGDCATNHADAEIFSPPYLFNPDGSSATRPNINTAPSAAPLGTSFSVTADTANLSYALVRMTSVTHTINNDQRRIPLDTVTGPDNTFTLTIPSDPGVVARGYYMLFAINDQGTPSVASTILIE